MANDQPHVHDLDVREQHYRGDWFTHKIEATYGDTTRRIAVKLPLLGLRSERLAHRVKRVHDRGSLHKDRVGAAIEKAKTTKLPDWPGPVVEEETTEEPAMLSGVGKVFTQLQGSRIQVDWNDIDFQWSPPDGYTTYYSTYQGDSTNAPPTYAQGTAK
jgi:hypothetical protein